MHLAALDGRDKGKAKRSCWPHQLVKFFAHAEALIMVSVVYSNGLHVKGVVWHSLL